MRRALLGISLLTATLFAATTAQATTTGTRRMLGQLYSGYSTTVQGASHISVGSKFLYYNRADMRIGAIAWYETPLDERVHAGGVGFVMDYVLKLSPSIDFFVGAHLGMCSGNAGAALYVEPGAGFTFYFGRHIGMEIRAGVKAPWMIGHALQLDHDTQVMGTVSMVFGRW